MPPRVCAKSAKSMLVFLELQVAFLCISINMNANVRTLDCVHEIKSITVLLYRCKTGQQTCGVF